MHNTGLTVQARRRPRALAPPDWRWQEALIYSSDVRQGRRSQVPSDPIVQLAVRALRVGPTKAGNHGYDGAARYLGSCWPLVQETIELGTMARRSAISAMLDVCLIKGWTHDEASIAGCPVGCEVYELYSKLFFDLGEMRAVHSWLQDFLIEPELHSRNSSLLRARLLACFGEGDVGVHAAISGKASEEETALMKQLSRTERQKRLFDYVVRYTNMAPEVYASVMEAALKSMSDQDFQQRMKDRESAGSESLETLASDMEAGIRAYSQHELQSFNKDGVDFVNQYTKLITGNNDNGKHDVQK